MAEVTKEAVYRLASEILKTLDRMVLQSDKTLKLLIDMNNELEAFSLVRKTWRNDTNAHR